MTSTIECSMEPSTAFNSVVMRKKGGRIETVSSRSSFPLPSQGKATSDTMDRLEHALDEIATLRGRVSDLERAIEELRRGRVSIATPKRELPDLPGLALEVAPDDEPETEADCKENISPSEQEVFDLPELPLGDFPDNGLGMRASWGVNTTSSRRETIDLSESPTTPPDKSETDECTEPLSFRFGDENKDPSLRTSRGKRKGSWRKPPNRRRKPAPPIGSKSQDWRLPEVVGRENARSYELGDLDEKMKMRRVLNHIPNIGIIMAAVDGVRSLFVTSDGKGGTRPISLVEDTFDLRSIWRAGDEDVEGSLLWAQSNETKSAADLCEIRKLISRAMGASPHSVQKYALGRQGAPDTYLKVGAMFQSLLRIWSQSRVTTCGSKITITPRYASDDFRAKGRKVSSRRNR